MIAPRRPLLGPPLATLFAGLLATSLLTAQAPPGKDHIRVGTWNLEQLGFRNPPRQEADFQKIAAFIKRMGVDVLAVQEVNGSAPLKRVRRHLGPDYQFIVGQSGTFHGQDTRISVGFIWNRTRVRLDQCEELQEFPRRAGDLNIFHRLPVCAVFSVRNPKGEHKLDFRIVTVHLKASRGRRNEAKRRAEVRTLRKWLQALRTIPNEDQDILVVGDFNHTYGAPAHDEFIVDQGIRYLRGRQLNPTIIHFDDPIDQIAVCPGIEEELVKDTFRVHSDAVQAGNSPDPKVREAELQQSKQLWRQSYSDHFPVTVDLDASRDRDEGARFKAPSHPLRRGGDPENEPSRLQSPIVVGAKVEVHLLGDPPIVRGTLLHPLGRWVHLRLDNGVVRAYPMQRAVSVTLSRK